MLRSLVASRFFASILAWMSRPMVLFVAAALTFGSWPQEGAARPMAPALGAASRITEFPLPLKESWQPSSIVTGPDGALWFNENKATKDSEPIASKIGRITTAGKVTFFAVPKLSTFTASITVGSDHAMWFTEYDASNIGRITTNGTITEFHLEPSWIYFPESIVPGPDGALWFTSNVAIGRITTSGSITGYACPKCYPDDLTFGPDGALWFTGGITPVVYRFAFGAFTRFSVPINSPLGAITSGPGNSLWMPNYVGDDLLSIDLRGRVTSHTFKTVQYHNPSSIITDRNGSLWFTYPSFGGYPDYIERYDPRSKRSELFQIPTMYAVPTGLTVGPDGNIWFTEALGGKIGRITVDSR